MYGGVGFLLLNIGSDVNIYYKDIVAIVSFEKETSEINRKFVENMIKKESCVIIDKEVHKSVIILNKKGVSKAYISPLSIKTIQKKMGLIQKFNLLDK